VDILIWDIKKGELASTLKGHTERISTIDFTEKGLMGSGSWDSSIRIWDINKFIQVQYIELDRVVIQSIAFSPNGKYIVSPGPELSLQIFDVETGTEVKRLKSSLPMSTEIQADYSPVITKIAFSPNGKYLVETKSGFIFVWDFATYQLLHTINEYIASIKAVCWGLNFNSDCTVLVSASTDRILRIYEVPSFKHIQSNEGPVRNFHMDVINNYIGLAAGMGVLMQVTDWKTGSLVVKWRTDPSSLFTKNCKIDPKVLDVSKILTSLIPQTPQTLQTPQTPPTEPEQHPVERAHSKKFWNFFKKK